MTAIPLDVDRKKRSIDWFPIVIGVLTMAMTLIFLVYPIFRAVVGAFVPNGEVLALANLSTVNFERFFVSASYQRAFWHSLAVGLAATGVATLLALPLAYAVARIDIPFRRAVVALSVLPLISPPFIGAYSWIILLGRNGLITRFIAQTFDIQLPSIYGPFGVIAALALGYFPYVFLIVQGALASSDPYVEEAARMMGASRWRVLRTITFPSILPSIAAGMLIVFIKVLGDFGVPSILGAEYQVLPTLIYYQIHGFFNLNAAAAIAMVNVALTVGALGVLAWVNRRRTFATITGVARASKRATGIGAKLVAGGYVAVILFVALLPQITVVVSSFVERWSGSRIPQIWGFGNFARIFTNLNQPVINSLLLGGAATILCVVFGTVTAYYVSRRRFFGRWALDLTIMLPFVLPGLVVGVAYLVGFNDGWIILTGTATILVLAYFTRRAAYIFRSVQAAVGQIDGKLEEASTLCGADWATTMRRVVIPLITPAILAGAILVFATLLGEISVTILLFSAKWKTISIAIYEYVLSDELHNASAMGTVAIVMTLVLVLGASRLVGRSMADLFR